MALEMSLEHVLTDSFLGVEFLDAMKWSAYIRSYSMYCYIKKTTPIHCNLMVEKIFRL